MVIGADPFRSRLAEPISNRRPARHGTGAAALLFRNQEVAMIKALMTPVLLGLGVALLIRMTAARRAY
jgi:hypothetical protein